MNETPKLSPTWPYLDGKQHSESEKHVEMKNLAIHWLLGQGFDIQDIEVEHCVYSPGTHGYTDVYAEQGGIEIYVECERGEPIPGHLSAGGKIPAKDGQLVYFLTEDSLYRVRYVPVTLEKSHSSSIFDEDGPETWERNKIQFKRLGSLPSKGESEYSYAEEANKREREKVSWL